MVRDWAFLSMDGSTVADAWNPSAQLAIAWPIVVLRLP